jgi:eukaryotic-like serine/threonine-protein kinase
MEHAVALHHDHLVLGRYRPLRPLGSGGSGSVWLVRDERSARDVALKVVPREGKAGSRAEREVEAATRLRHPRCLRALALERDDRHVYVAYEYVPGRTLRQALRHGELGDAAAVEAAAQVLEALAHAHGKGVVHRDVKPANVMLEEAETVSVRVLDFGLAQLEEADTLTAVGDVPGTLAYIAPERLAGREATGAADVWSAGVVLWEALAGRHPFSAVSPLETARRVGAGAPPLAKLRPDLPRRLTGAVDRMLSLSPSHRPGAKEAALALRAAWSERAERPRAAMSRTRLAERAGPAMLAGVYAGAAVWLMPFFPAGWPLLLAVLAGVTALASPAAGLAFALAVPILPLGNLSLGLAVVYACLALGWFLLFARDARCGLIFLLGPALAPAQALALVPVLVLNARGAARRACLAAASVLAGAGVAGLTISPLPFTGELAADKLGVAGASRPGHALGALMDFLAGHPALWIEAAVLVAATLAAPHARGRGLWAVAVWGAGFLAAVLLAPAGVVPAFPTVLWVWLGAGLLAVPVLRTRR